MKTMLTLIALFGIATTSRADGGDATDIIRQMYKASVTVFDGGIYEKKYNQAKHCELYRRLFSDALIHVEKVGHQCEIISYTGNVRFPNMDIGEIDYPNEMPPYRILNATVGPEGEVAVPVNIDDGSRVLYFLKKSNEHYKIINFVTSIKWPRDPNSEDKSNRCPFYFSLSPEHDPFQISMIPKDCQQGLWIP